MLIPPKPLRINCPEGHHPFLSSLPPSLLLQSDDNFAPARALLLQRHGVGDSLEAALVKHLDLVWLDFAILDQLSDDGDVGGEIVVDGRVALDGGARFANQAEDDGVDGEGVVGGFGRPGWMDGSVLEGVR